jgi:hypothetical protein
MTTHAKLAIVRFHNDRLEWRKGSLLLMNGFLRSHRFLLVAASHMTRVKSAALERMTVMNIDMLALLPIGVMCDV